jgi:hypothetical protein
MRVHRGDVVSMVDLRDGTRTTVIVERLDPPHHAIVRPVHDEGRWRVGTGFLVPLEAR